MGTQRTAIQAQELWTQHRAAFLATARGNGLPPDAAQKHFQHWLANNMRNGDDPVAAWQSDWDQIDRRLRQREQERFPDSMDLNDTAALARYREWVISDPAKMDERLGYDIATYEAQTQSANRLQTDIRNSEAYQTMAPEAQAFYSAYLNGGDHINADAGSLGNNILDIQNSEHQQRITDAYEATKRAVVLRHVANHLTDPNERTAFTTWLQSADVAQDLPSIDPQNTPASREQVNEWYQRGAWRNSP